MNAIVAISKNRGIGMDNDLLFHIPEDLKFFKEMTLGKVIIMGRKTLESLPGGKPLPKRTTIVLTRRSDETEGVITAKNVEELFKIIKGYNSDDVLVCGGEQIYKLLLPYCEKAYVTVIDKEVCANKFFPDIENDENWELTSVSEKKEHNGIFFTFNTYTNKVV